MVVRGTSARGVTAGWTRSPNCSPACLTVAPALVAVDHGTGSTRPRRACSRHPMGSAPAPGSWRWRPVGRMPSRSADTSGRRSAPGPCAPPAPRPPDGHQRRRHGRAGTRPGRAQAADRTVALSSRRRGVTVLRPPAATPPPPTRSIACSPCRGPRYPTAAGEVIGVRPARLGPDCCCLLASARWSAASSTSRRGAAYHPAARLGGRRARRGDRRGPARRAARGWRRGSRSRTRWSTAPCGSASPARTAAACTPGSRTPCGERPGRAARVALHLGEPGRRATSPRPWRSLSGPPSRRCETWRTPSRWSSTSAPSPCSPPTTRAPGRRPCAVLAYNTPRLDAGRARDSRTSAG